MRCEPRPLLLLLFAFIPSFFTFSESTFVPLFIPLTLYVSSLAYLITYISPLSLILSGLLCVTLNVGLP
jgi:hypothetical protein